MYFPWVHVREAKKIKKKTLSASGFHLRYYTKTFVFERYPEEITRIKSFFLFWKFNIIIYQTVLSPALQQFKIKNIYSTFRKIATI